MQELERYFVVSKDIQSFHVKVLSNIFLEYKIAEDFLKSLADEYEVEHLICKVLEESCPQETADTPPRGGVDAVVNPQHGQLAIAFDKLEASYKHCECSQDLYSLIELVINIRNGKQ